MTAAYATAAPPSPRPNGRLGDRLEQMHRQWLRNLREVVKNVEAHDSGIWPRWNAIRYVDTTFSEQFERERAAIARLTQNIEDSQVTRLWVAGELIAMLRWQLCHSVALCQHAAEFSDIFARLLRAIEYWVAAVEDVVGALGWADLPTQARQDFAALGNEQPQGWSDLPISLVTSL